MQLALGGQPNSSWHPHHSATPELLGIGTALNNNRKKCLNFWAPVHVGLWHRDMGVVMHMGVCSEDMGCGWVWYWMWGLGVGYGDLVTDMGCERVLEMLNVGCGIGRGDVVLEGGGVASGCDMSALELGCMGEAGAGEFQRFSREGLLYFSG